MVLCKIRELKRQNKKDLFIIIIYFFGLVLGYMKNDFKIKKKKKIMYSLKILETLNFSND